MAAAVLAALPKHHVNEAETRRAMAWAGALAPERRARLPGPPRLPCELGSPREKRDLDQLVARATLISSLPAARWMRIGRGLPVMLQEEMAARSCRVASGRERGIPGWQHR
jgi:uncharacterized protein YbaR (Trm112 family)